MPLAEELLQYCHTFFAEFDFILMLFHYVVILFIIMMLLKTVLPEEMVATNLTFNIAVMTLFVICSNMTKNTFPAGYFRLTDETKM